ncbi:periplasmic chaperone for outer membrane proteins Skp [Acinetobacter marinus]|uniref:Periplasmic chaperone for outer membrane proteins Skp n=1 Tax=Acinetobacter marinus TaxID=281375 RepID=A0A1G6HQR6_9GAMM|nr:OmpH family outer membrane protein [Acinetobacter marinus]SDB96205.1 periplasmic chaperone for outer membrane proteins Skp [Acinetobacter marinus]
MRNFLVCSAVMLGLMSSGAAFAEKYAVVDIQKAATDTSYMKSQMATLESALKPQQQKHERLTKELTALRQKAQNDAKVMKQADLQKLEQDYATKMNEFNANATGMQKRAQDTLANINKTLAPKIEQATEALRKQGGYSMIIDRKSVVSFDPAIDLTSQVTQQVNATLK